MRAACEIRKLPDTGLPASGTCEDVIRQVGDDPPLAPRGPLGRTLVPRTHRASPTAQRVRQHRRSTRRPYSLDDGWNGVPKPFVWHNTAEEIIIKVCRGRDTFTRIKTATGHQPRPPVGDDHSAQHFNLFT